jgi:hypothetical protein
VWRQAGFSDPQGVPMLDAAAFNQQLATLCTEAGS